MAFSKKKRCMKACAQTNIIPLLEIKQSDIAEKVETTWDNSTQIKAALQKEGGEQSSSVEKLLSQKTVN